MKENLHPKYEETTIKCACGNVIERRSYKERTSVLKYAPSAIHSLLVSKSWLTQAAALICLRSAMVFKRNNVQGFLHF